MQYLAELGNGQELKFYYNQKVYDPHFSSIDTAILANGFIFGNIALLDVATGCGVTGLVLKHIHPEIHVTLSDIDPEARRIAKLNAKRLGLEVSVEPGDILPANDKKYHIITANLPSFDAEQMVKEELHGPEIAYNGGKDGLDLYTRLFKEAKDRCVVLVCEVQLKRQEAFLSVAQLNGWTEVAAGGTSFALIKGEE